MFWLHVFVLTPGSRLSTANARERGIVFGPSSVITELARTAVRQWRAAGDFFSHAQWEFGLPSPPRVGFPTRDDRFAKRGAGTSGNWRFRASFQCSVFYFQS